MYVLVIGMSLKDGLIMIQGGRIKGKEDLQTILRLFSEKQIL